MKILYLYISTIFILSVHSKKFEDEQKKPAWAKKDIRDYSDVDMQKLLDQWEEDEEPLAPDELPDYLRPQPQIDMSKLNLGDPQSALRESKKGRTLMMFVSVNGNPTKYETEEITKLWHGSLTSSHIQSERYVIGDDRVIFLFKDGSEAWTAKDFFVEQEKCKEVTLENVQYPGKHNSPKTEL